METEFKGMIGPWHSYRSEYNELCVGDPNGDTVCEVAEYEDEKDESEANARLIAAAPELLEALQKTNDLLKDLNNKHTGDDRYRDFAIQYAENRELISKALEG